MKTKSTLLLISFFCICLNQLKAQKTKVEQVTKVCEGLSPSEKPIVAIMPFKLAAPGASQAVGTGLPDMLMNAIFNSGCFRVVERERLNDLMKEQGLGLSGAGDENSFAQVGKLVGANVLIFGTITEFTENESGTKAGGGGLGFFKRGIGAIAGGVGTTTSHIGYTIKFVNPNTGELLDSKSFDKNKTAVGVAAGSIFGGYNGVGAGSGSFYKSKSMQDVVEESLIEAVTYMSKNKSAYLDVTANARANANSGPGPVNKDGCSLLKMSRKPKFMIIIPEEHLAGLGSKYDPNRVDINVNNNNGNINNNNYNQPQAGGSAKNNSENSGRDAINQTRNFFRPPDPAGETEIMKRFLEYGFEVVDAKQFDNLRADKDFQNAYSDASLASKIGSRFGADIIIVGEAFSEYAKTENGMSSCRARVEVKAVITSNAKILAADGLHGSGLDISEVIAGKTALKSAGDKIADYFIAQLCNKSDDISAAIGAKSSSNKTALSSTESEILFKNVDFNKAMTLEKMIKSLPGVSATERTSFENSVAVYKVSHTGNTNTLIEKLATAKTALKLNVLSITEHRADIDVLK